MTSCLNLPPSAEHQVHQSIGVIGQAKRCIGLCTGTLLHLDNCHFAVWMPHTMVCDRRSPHRPSTPASEFGHPPARMTFMDKGAQVQPEVATYAFPQLRIMTTTTEYLRPRFKFIMSASQMLGTATHGKTASLELSASLDGFQAACIWLHALPSKERARLLSCCRPQLHLDAL